MMAYGKAELKRLARKHGQTVDHVMMDPKGSINRNDGWRLSTADAADRKAAREASKRRTAAWKAKLAEATVTQHGDVWLIKRKGHAPQKYDSLNAALAAL